MVGWIGFVISEWGEVFEEHLIVVKPIRFRRSYIKVQSTLRTGSKGPLRDSRYTVVDVLGKFKSSKRQRTNE